MLSSFNFYIFIITPFGINWIHTTMKSLYGQQLIPCFVNVHIVRIILVD